MFKRRKTKGQIKWVSEQAFTITEERWKMKALVSKKNIQQLNADF